jgi:hypothetical protein
MDIIKYSHCGTLIGWHVAMMVQWDTAAMVMLARRGGEDAGSEGAGVAVATAVARVLAWPPLQ